METKLIELNDGLLVEVYTTGNEIHPISGNSADKVDSNFAKIKSALEKTILPITETCNKLNKISPFEEVEIELGFSFETEGNIYIAKAKANASISIKLKYKPNSDHN